MSRTLNISEFSKYTIFKLIIFSNTKQRIEIGFKNRQLVIPAQHLSSFNFFVIAATKDWKHKARLLFRIVNISFFNQKRIFLLVFWRWKEGCALTLLETTEIALSLDWVSKEAAKS